MVGNLKGLLLQIILFGISAKLFYGMDLLLALFFIQGSIILGTITILCEKAKNNYNNWRNS